MGKTALVSAHPLHMSDHQKTWGFCMSQRAEPPSLLIRPHGTICLTSSCTEHTCNFGVQLLAPAQLSDSTEGADPAQHSAHVPPQVREPCIQAQGELPPGPQPGGSLGTWMSPMANMGWWPVEAQPCRLGRWHGWRRDPFSSGQLWDQGKGLSKLHIHIYLDQIENFSGCLSP